MPRLNRQELEVFLRDTSGRVVPPRRPREPARDQVWLRNFMLDDPWRDRVGDRRATPMAGPTFAPSLDPEDAARSYVGILIHRKIVADAMAALAVPMRSWSLHRLLAEYAHAVPMGLGGALGKVAGAWSEADFVRLSAVLAEGGAGAKALRHARRLTARFVQALSVLPMGLREGVIGERLSAEQAHLLAQAAERLGACADPAIMNVLRERLTRAQSTAHMFAMLIDALGLQPQPDFPDLAAPWFIPLRTSAAMERTGRRFRNCLREHVPRMLRGEAYYFEMTEPAPAIVQIVRCEEGGWRLGEVAGASNRAPRHDVMEQLQQHLQAHQVSTWRARTDPLIPRLILEAEQA